MIKNYIAYLKDNPEHYWFKRKLYGWGWTPALWQGWFVLGLYALSVFVLSLQVSESDTLQDVLWSFILPVVVATLILIVICYKKGERPRFQWGRKK